MNKIKFATATIICLSGTSAFATTYTMSGLGFSTSTPQSSFGSGDAVIIEDTIDVTTTWDESFKLGGTTDLGSAPNPVWEGLNAAYVTARGTYSAAQSTYNAAVSTVRTLERAYSDCLGTFVGNVVTCAPVKVPIGAAIVTRAGAKEARDAALAVQNAAYREREQVSSSLDLGEGGAEAGVTSRGTVGLELDYKLNAGSVDPKLIYSAAADVPQTVVANQEFSLGTSSELIGGSVNSFSPQFEASISQILDVELNAYGKVCVGGCLDGSVKVVDIDEKVELISINPQEVTFFEDALTSIDPTLKVSLPLLKTTAKISKATVPQPNPISLDIDGIPVPGFDKTVGPLVELARVELQAPTINTIGQKTGDKITSSSSESDQASENESFIKLLFDVDGIASTLSGGVLPAGGVIIPFGPSGLNAGVTLDVFDIKAGPELNLFQEFEIDSRLMVNLKANKQFSYTKFNGYETKVQRICIPIPFVSDICYNRNIPDFEKPIFETVTSDVYVGAWDGLPDFMIGETTEFMPTFFTEASLRSTFGVQFAVALDLLLGKGSINAGALSGEIGPLLEENYSFDLGRFDIFDEKFALLDFNQIAGSAFTIMVDGDPGVSTVPLSASGFMLLTALSGLGVASRRRVRKANS